MSDTLNKIWNDIDIGLNSAFNLPMKVTNNNIAVDISVSTNSEGLNTIGNISLGIAALGLIVGAAPLGILFYGAVGFLSKLLGGQEDKSAEVKRKLYKECDKNYDSIKDKLIEACDSQIEAFIRSVENSVNGRVEDMRSQLKAVMAMKQSQESDVKKQIAALKQQQEYVQDLCGQMQTLLTR